MLRARFACALAALGLVLGCGDDDPVTRSNSLAFEGVAWVVPDADGKLVVAWKPAPEATDYRVYVSRIQGRELKTVPMRASGTSVVVTPDRPNERYYVAVRAADAAGVEDANTVVKSAIAAPDRSPPTFAGAKAVEPAGNAGARVTWDPASDDFTPPEAIVYEVLAGRTRDTLRRVATTGPGDTTISLSQLGSPSEPFLFAVVAKDIANNASGQGAAVSGALGQDATVPVFAGCDVATALGARSAEVRWTAATDNHSPAAQLTYEIYASRTAGQHDFTAPPSAKVTAGTTATLEGLEPGATYFVVCRARDVAGNLDTNTAERSFVTPSDVTKPTFAGITGKDFDGTNRSVELSWSAATDDQTPPGAIVYDIYESLVPGKYDFAAPPRATTAPGATSFKLTNLASRANLNWLVRARDRANNRDDNMVEVSDKTLTSFSIDVQRVFNKNCAVVGCHVTGPQAGGLNLAPAFAYDQLDRTSILGSGMRRVTAKNLDQSWLYIKINPNPPRGLVMPAPQTGTALTDDDKAVITSWILEGALRN